MGSLWKVVLLTVAVHCVLAAQDKDCFHPCPRIYSPVCGSDGKTYGNKCTLEAAQKCKNEDLKMAYDGECVQCLPRMRTGVCTYEYNPVCGKDGKTYANLCTFCYSMYQLQNEEAELSFSHMGECKPIETEEECPESSRHGFCTYEYMPVCANDGVTYATKCVMCATMFDQQKQGKDIKLHVVHEGECQQIEKLRGPREPTCYPRMKFGVCTKELRPVCGTDDKTYANECLLCYARYQQEENGTGEKLNIQHDGRCQA